jgi:5-hydroxyisourate hydrolase-like protein (transthyretin family)
VQILTSSGDPVDSQFTNSLGQSASTQLANGIYQVVAAAPGYLTSVPVIANLSGSVCVAVNILLTADPRTTLNTLYGLVLDQVSGSRLTNATVILTDSLSQVVATTSTNSEGQYLLYEISNGSYTLSASRSGYQAPTPLAITVSGSQIAQTNISLAPETVTEGTVQGLITDQSGAFLAGASVGLYSVVDSTETLVQTTFANNDGFYLFGNVAAGSYLVKAKVDTLV